MDYAAYAALCRDLARRHDLDLEEVGRCYARLWTRPYGSNPKPRFEVSYYELDRRVVLEEAGRPARELPEKKA